MRIENHFEVRRKPAADLSVCAVKKPMQIGEVIVAGHYRYIVLEEISKDEFERQLAESDKHRAGVAGNMTLRGSVATKAEYRPGSRPDFDPEHFYRVRAEFARPE